jgi:hypothetical protein
MSSSKFTINNGKKAQCVRLRARRALQCIWLAKQPNKKGAAGEAQKGNAIAHAAAVM